MELQSSAKMMANSGVQSMNMLYISSQHVKFMMNVLLYTMCNNVKNVVAFKKNDTLLSCGIYVRTFHFVTYQACFIKIIFIFHPMFFILLTSCVCHL